MDPKQWTPNSSVDPATKQQWTATWTPNSSSVYPKQQHGPHTAAWTPDSSVDPKQWTAARTPTDRQSGPQTAAWTPNNNVDPKQAQCGLQTWRIVAQNRAFHHVEAIGVEVT